MKRRDFLRTVGATAAISGLPAGVANAARASVAAPVRYGMSPYVWAKYTARINQRLTPDMLTRFLGFSDAEAQRMIRRLTFEKVLAAPDASGISRTSGDYLSSIRDRRDTVRQMIQAAREKVQASLAESESETSNEDAMAARDPDASPPDQSS